MASQERIVFFSGATFVWTVEDEGIVSTDSVYMNVKQELVDETYLLETSSVGYDAQWVVVDGSATLTLSAAVTEELGAVEAADYSVYKVSLGGIRSVLKYGEVFSYDHATLGAV